MYSETMFIVYAIKIFYVFLAKLCNLFLIIFLVLISTLSGINIATTIYLFPSFYFQPAYTVIFELSFL